MSMGRRGGAKRALFALALLAFVATAGGQAAAAPQEVGAIGLPAGDPTSLGVYEPTNKLFVADDNGGEVREFDGATLQHSTTVSGVGGSGFQMVIDQSLGRVYVASDHHPFTTGYNDGTGKIAVIDVETHLVTQVEVPGQNPSTSNFNLAVDEGRDRVYVAHSGGFGYIDSANAFHAVAGAPIPFLTYDIEVNGTGDEVYYATGDKRIAIVDGASLEIAFFDFDPTGAKIPLDFAVGEQENKVYLTMVIVPGQAEPGILILDRDTGSHKFVGRSDLNPVVFNQATNRLFAGVQVGTVAGVLEGASDVLTDVTLPDGGVGAMDVRAASDNAYMATQQATYVLNGSSKCFARFPSGAPLRGGLVANGIAINQSTGRAYVVNDQEQAHVKVFADGGVVCPAEPSPPDGSPLGLDIRPPRLRLAGLRVQDIDKLALRVTSDEAAKLAARGTAVGPGVKRRLRFKKVTKTVRAGKTVTLRFRLSRRDLAAIKRALPRQSRRAKLVVKATDDAGNSRTARRGIRLRN
jgi:DNA-binding beta-propeller fold protein YncE